MTRKVADEVKLKITAFDHSLDVDVESGLKKGIAGFLVTVTTTILPNYQLKELLKISEGRSLYIEPNKEMKGYIDFVIY